MDYLQVSAGYHISDKYSSAEDITEEIQADHIVIVCLDTEKAAIQTVLNQVGWSSRIQGIITLTDLDCWYKVCLSNKYKNSLGNKLLHYLKNEFNLEFPSSEKINPFMEERGYGKIILPSGWNIIKNG